MAKDEHKTQIIVAVVGLIGVLGTAVVANWSSIFPKSEPSPSPPPTNPPAVTPPGPGPRPARPLSLSGTVFDRASNRKLSAVSIHLYKDVTGGRPQTFQSRVATTGPEGSFLVKLPNVSSQDLPLRIALSHSDWAATQITAVRITEIQDYSQLNIPVEVSMKPPPPQMEQDISVSFSSKQEGTQYFITGTVKNKSNRTYPCARLSFEMSTSFQARQAGETPRPLGVLEVDVRDIGPLAEKTFRKLLPRQVGLSYKSIERCP